MAGIAGTIRVTGWILARIGSGAVKCCEAGMRSLRRGDWSFRYVSRKVVHIGFVWRKPGNSRTANIGIRDEIRICKSRKHVARDVGRRWSAFLPGIGCFFVMDPLT